MFRRINLTRICTTTLHEQDLEVIEKLNTGNKLAELEFVHHKRTCNLLPAKCFFFSLLATRLAQPYIGRPGLSSAHLTQRQARNRRGCLRGKRAARRIVRRSLHSKKSRWVAPLPAAASTSGTRRPSGLSGYGSECVQTGSPSFGLRRTR